MDTPGVLTGGAAIAALLLIAAACGGMSEQETANTGRVVGGGPGYMHSGGVEGAVGAAVGEVVEHPVPKPK
jgi:hypothetical protein